MTQLHYCLEVCQNNSAHFRLLIKKQLTHYYEERVKRVAARHCNWLPQETDVFQNTPKLKSTIDMFCSLRQSLEL